MANKVSFIEVIGKDAKKLQKFYAELFGWTYKDVPGMNYGLTDPDATGIGGGIGTAPGDASWATFYVRVDSVDKALEQAKRLGGRELVPVTRLPDVTFAVFADPEGHPVGLSEQPNGSSS